MRNLKRVLTLVMAVAMMMSLLVVGAGAAFNDQNKIENTDAVNMNVALGIIKGRDTGDFDPAGNVTRAEMAKMICVLLNGGKEPNIGTKATATFKDTKGHWAEAYIEYCSSLGIVAGMGDGTFAPNANVTGTQAAKMLLVALGYDAAFEGFNGASWSVKINVAANQKELYDDLAIDPNAALNRDDAAQMVWNALNAKEVKYTYSLSTVNGQLQTIQVREDKDDDLITAKFKTLDTDVTTGILSNINYSSTKNEYTYTVTGSTPGSFVTKADFTNLFGHNVTVVAKARDNVYGIYAEDSNVVFSGLIGDIDFTNATIAKGATVEFDDEDYDLTKNTAGDAITAKIAAFNTAGATVDNAPANVEAFYQATAIDNNDDDKIDLIVYNPVVWAKVTYVNKDYIRVAEGTSANLNTTKFEFEDNDIYSGVAKDDYVLINLNDVTYGTDCGVVTELKEQTAKLTALSGDYATLGGTKYDKTLVTLASSQLKDEIDFLVINNYLVKATENSGDVNLKDYLLVAGVAGSINASGYVDAKVYFTDGTSSTVSVKSVDGVTVTSDVATHPDKDTVYTYELKSGNYVLTAFDPAEFDDGHATTAAWTPSSSASDANAKVAGYKFATDAVVFLKDGTDYSVVTGAKMAKVTGAATVTTYGAEENDDTGYTNVTFAFITSAAVSSSDAEYGFITTDIETLMNDDDELYYSFKMWNGTDTVTMNTVADTSAIDTLFDDGDLAKGVIITYTMDGTEIDDIDVLPAAGSGFGAVTAYDSDSIKILTGTDTYVNLDIDKDDTTILYISRSDKTGDKTGAISKADKTDGTVTTYVQAGTPNTYYYANVLYIGVNNGTADLIVIDVNNDILDVQ